MIHKTSTLILVLLLLGAFLTGCPKKVARIPPIEEPPVKDPVMRLLNAFSEVEYFESDASIRIETVRKGKELKYPLNGYVFFEKPDKLRILGFIPFGMNLFDALYLDGKFLILSPMDKKAYTGEVSEFEDLIEKAKIQMSMDKTGGSLIPNIIRLALEEKKTRVEIKLKGITMGTPLPGNAFLWEVPDGVHVRPLAQLVRTRSSNRD